MQILNRENLLFEILPETLDDLWVLSRFIEQSDVIYSTTQRKVKIGDKGKQVTKLIYVELQVTKISYDTEVLRVSGEILNETEFTAVGQSHTLTYKVMDSIKLLKNKLLNFQKELLDKSVESKQSQNLLIVLDKDDLLVVEFSEFSFKVLVNEGGLGSKKYHNLEVNEEQEKFNIIKSILTRNYNQIILSGPGNYKEKLKLFIESKGIKNLSLFHWHDVSASSIQTIIRNIYKENVLLENQLSKESEIVSSLLKNINKNKKYSYGYQNISSKVNEGSVQYLLLTTNFIDLAKEEDFYTELVSLMENVEKQAAKIFILNSKNDPGRIIDGLGGIASILRY